MPAPLNDTQPAAEAAAQDSFRWRLMSTLTLRAGSFRSIAGRRALLHGFLVALVGCACAGSVGTLMALFTVIYPLFFFASLVFFTCTCRLVTAFFVPTEERSELPSYLAWTGGQFFAVAPFVLGLVPLLGGVAGLIYSIVLHVVAIRDMSGRSTGEGVVVFLISALVQFVAWVVIALLGGLTLLTGVIGSLGVDTLAR